MLHAALWLSLLPIMYCLRISAAGGSFPKPLSSAEERYYLELAAKGDVEARNVLVERNLRLVAHIMKKYYTQADDQEDLISIGTVGLIKGISTFDESKGARLATYAARCVENEILMYFRKQKKSAGELSLSESIDSGKDGSALSLMDVICSDEDLFEDYSNRELYKELYYAIGQVLTDRERCIISERFGLNGCTPKTQREVAEKTGISRSYVSRIEKKALKKLEDHLRQ